LRGIAAVDGVPVASNTAHSFFYQKSGRKTTGGSGSLLRCRNASRKPSIHADAPRARRVTRVDGCDRGEAAGSQRTQFTQKSRASQAFSLRS
jgi:hypothetical protein